MTEALYMNDSYLREWSAKVVKVTDGRYIILDKTAFYPKGGGQPWDEGIIRRNDDEFKVVYVGKFSGSSRYLSSASWASCSVSYVPKYL